MKQIIILIIVGVVLALIMVYYGVTSFEGTYEDNVYQNSLKYNKTAPIIKELEEMIKNVKLENLSDNDFAKLTYTTDFSEKYQSLQVAKIEVSSPGKEKSIEVITYENSGDTYEGVNQKLSSGLYVVTFYFPTSDNDFIKVLKSAYVE